MSADKAINMISSAVKQFNLTGIWLRDDEFYINEERARDIAKGLIPLNIKWYTSGTRVDIFNKTPEKQIELYKLAGAHTLKFGAESGCNRILKLMNKGITKEETIEANLKAMRHNIIPAFALIVGFPTETFNEMEETIDLAKRLKEDNPKAQLETVSTYNALPGTPLWNLAIDKGLLPPGRLEGWANWIADEYDPEGNRLPWYDDEDRQAVGNICYLSMLSNAVTNVIDSLDNPILAKILRASYAIPHSYYKWRFFNKHYKHTWELNLVRQLRQRLFYNGIRALR